MSASVAWTSAMSAAERSAVAGNPNTPVETLMSLSGNFAWSVRSAVAGNPNTPAEALVRLSRDENWDVRLRRRPEPENSGGGIDRALD